MTVSSTLEATWRLRSCSARAAVTFFNEYAGVPNDIESACTKAATASTAHFNHWKPLLAAP